MLKSPEEYLSSLEFDAGPAHTAPPRLNAEERAFVEKYMGADALAGLPEQAPEPVALLLPVPEPPAPAPLLLCEKEIVIAPAREETPIASQAVQIEVPCATAPPKIIIAEPVHDVALGEEAEAEPVLTGEITEAPVIARADIAPKTESPTVEAALAEKSIEVQAKGASQHALSAETALKEKLKQESEVQMVSFFVGGQLFLLPVEGIQEVLRHMELIKVPQAPDFVAGVINLRGRVTPVVHLSALVTNAARNPYDESNFIIITGTETLQLGLIIDKVSSMHMVPQKKIIWNPESKLAEAAEFLSAIVDLDDRVCGVVSPEMITRLILPEV